MNYVVDDNLNKMKATIYMNYVVDDNLIKMKATISYELCCGRYSFPQTGVIILSP